MPTKRRRVMTNMTEEEFTVLQTNAARAGISHSEYLRRISRGQEVKSLEHIMEFLELRRLRADLGRLGGLVKQALAAGAEKNQVYHLLRELDERQRELQVISKRLEDDSSRKIKKEK